MPPPDNPGPWLTQAEAAAYLRVHPDTLRRHANRGQIRRYGEGKGQRYRRTELDRFLEQNRS